MQSRDARLLILSMGDFFFFSCWLLMGNFIFHTGRAVLQPEGGLMAQKVSYEFHMGA